MKIVVSSNCQTAGLAAAIRAMTDVSEVVAIPLIGEIPESVKIRLKAELADAWAFIHAANNSVAATLAAETAGAVNPGLRCLRVPLINFTGFHPDICYAWNRDSRKLTDPHYNSVIAVWCYARGMSVAQTVALFGASTFQALGYLDAWQRSVDALRKAFVDSDLAGDFADFFLHIKRCGVFMHSMNHPRVDVINHLASMVVRRLGLTIRRDIVMGEINDGLNNIVWPVYPAIADALGVAGGSYTWKFLAGHRFIDGLTDYVEQAFSAYVQQGIEPARMAIAFQDASPIDRRLRALVGN